MNIIKDRILHGVYPVDTNIPSEPQLEKEFQVSKITVRNAIKALVQEGYLETSSGKGTRVVRNTSTSKLSKLKRFTELLVEEGHLIGKQLLNVGLTDMEKNTEAYRLFGEQALKVERLYLLNGTPYIHYTHYLPARLAAASMPDLSIQSLYDWLEEQGIVPEHYRDEFAVSPAPDEVRTALGIAVDPAFMLKRSRYAYGIDGELVEYSVGFYNTDRQSYVVNYDV